MPDSPAIASRDHSPSLTGLRAWAALAVVLYHLSADVGTLPGLSHAVRFGRSGVALFFVLSGFVLTYTYYGRSVPKRVFYWRRWARVWPLHVAVLAGGVVLLHALGTPPTWAAVLRAMALMHAWTPDPTVVQDVFGASWSLSDEAFFYALFPLLLAPIAQLWARWRMVLASLVAVYAGYYLIVSLTLDGFQQSWALDYLPTIRILQFLAGMLVGVAFKHGARAPVRLGTAVALVAAWHVVLLVWDRVPDGFVFQPYSASQAFAFPLYALLIWAAADRDRDGRPVAMLASTAAVTLGHWSYAWYLVHKAGIVLWLHAVGSPSTMAETALAWAAITAGTLLLSAVCYIGLERPVEQWLKSRGPKVAPPARSSVLASR